MPLDPRPGARRDADANASTPRTYALRNQVLRLLLGAVVMPALLLAVLQTVSEYRDVERRQQDRLRLAVRLTATSIDQFVETHAAAITLVAGQASMHREPPDLVGLRALFPAFVTVLTTDAQGRITRAEPAARAVGAVGRSVADRDYFQVSAAERRPYVSNAFEGRGFGTEPLVAVAAPVVADGEFTGIVEGSIRVDAFTRLRSTALRSRGQEMLVVDRVVRVIHASAGLPFAFREDVGHAPFLRGREQDDGVSAAVLDSTMLPDGSAWVAWSQLHSGWRVAIFEPRAAALAAVWRHAAETAAVLLLATLLVLIVAHAQIRRVGRAVAATLENLRAIAAGEQPPSAPMANIPSELKPIAAQVVQLAGNLQDANAELRDALAGQQAMSRDLAEANERLEETVRARTAELEVANHDLERLSRTDPLTGALNRRGLAECHAAATDRHGHLHSRLALVMLDVDFFKAYNDRYGHPAGDQVLRRIVAIASAALRGEPDRIARLGGEEFLVVLPDADATTAQRIAERIRAEVHALGIPHADGIDARVTVSLGMAVGEPGDPVDPVVNLADEALYRAKARGRDRVET